MPFTLISTNNIVNLQPIYALKKSSFALYAHVFYAQAEVNAIIN